MGVKEDFSIKLKDLRRQNGLTQATLAEAAECSQSTIRDYENLVSFPGPDMLERLAAVLKVRVMDLFDFGESQPKDDSLDIIRNILTLDSEALAQLNSQIAAIKKGMEKRKQSKSKEA